MSCRLRSPRAQESSSFVEPALTATPDEEEEERAKVRHALFSSLAQQGGVPAVPAALSRQGSHAPAPSESFVRGHGAFGIEKSRCSHALRSQETVSGLVAKVGDAESFQTEVVAVRKRIGSMSRYTIDARKRHIKAWDGVLCCALLFTAIVTPFEVGFYETGLTAYAGPVNFTINRIVDAIFAFDILLTFFMPYRTSHKKGGQMIYDQRRIRRHYLKSWFFFDFLTCIPFDLIFSAVASSLQMEATEANLTAIRMMRLLRILKLVRLVRVARIVDRWKDHVSVSFGFMSLLKFSFMISFLAHWLACLWGFIGQSSTSEAWSGYEHGLSWRQKARISDDAAPLELYGIALYVSLNNIFGGSCEIQAANYGEFYAQAFMMFLGSSVWAYVIGSVCGILATLNPAEIEFRQTMDEVNSFCSDQHLPAELSVRLRVYFRNLVYMIKSSRHDTLLAKMSTRLRGDAAIHICEYHLKSVPFLVHAELEPEFMSALAIRFKKFVYCRLEHLPCTSLFIVERGLVAKRGRLGLIGSCFGKDVILSNDSLRDLGDAIALTFVQTITLTQADIFELLPDYPLAYHVVRKAALRMALIRALCKAAKIVKRLLLTGADDASMQRSTSIELFDKALEQIGNDRLAEEAPSEVRVIPITSLLSKSPAVAPSATSPTRRAHADFVSATPSGAAAASCDKGFGGSVGGGVFGGCAGDASVAASVAASVSALSGQVQQSQAKVGEMAQRLSSLEGSVRAILGRMDADLQAKAELDASIRACMQTVLLAQQHKGGERARYYQKVRAPSGGKSTPPPRRPERAERRPGRPSLMPAPLAVEAEGGSSDEGGRRGRRSDEERAELREEGGDDPEGGLDA